MDKLKELVVAYISKTQGKTPEEVSSLLFKKEADVEVLKDDAQSALFELDKNRINSLNQKFDTERKETYDKGYNKAKAEVLGKLEDEAKSKYGITEDKRGLELIDAIVSAKSKSSNGEPTEDQVKSSKTYLDAVAQLKKEKAEEVKQWTEKYESREKQLQKEATFKNISDQAVKFVKSLNPILPEDQKKADNQLGILLEQIKGFDFEVKEDGKIVILKEGKVLCDEHSHPIAFEDLVKERASNLWDFKTGEDRSGTGNNNSGKGGGNGNESKGYKGPTPKSNEEYLKMLGDLKDEKAQIELTKVWNSAKNGN